MKSQINILRLVYTPVSNQEAEWIKDDNEVKECISQSNLYMICHRAEAFFQFPDEDFSNVDVIPFSILCNGVEDSGYFKISEMIAPYRNLIEEDKVEIELEIGKKLFRVWKNSLESDEKELINWFTIDKTLFDKSRGSRFIDGLDNYREFTTYKLLYVGISKKEDSLTRLVVRPHDKRIRVLSNEFPIGDQSRLTDEIILLFFGVDPLHISQFTEDMDVHEFLNPTTLDSIPIIADAEKAFVNILNSKYNAVKFKDYPRGQDGLYNSGLTRYMYIIGESLTLETDKEIIRGEYSNLYGFGNRADAISIEGDHVTLMKHDALEPEKNSP